MEDSQIDAESGLTAVVEDGILSFNSEYDFSQTLEAIKVNEVSQLMSCLSLGQAIHRSPLSEKVL